MLKEIKGKIENFRRGLETIVKSQMEIPALKIFKGCFTLDLSEKAKKRFKGCFIIFSYLENFTKSILSVTLNFIRIHL